MNLRKSIFIALLLSFLFISAEEKIQDTLQDQMVTASKPERIIFLHKKLVDYLFTDAMKAKDYALESLNLAVEENIDSLIAESYYRLGLAYLYAEYWSLASECYVNAMDTEWGQKNKLFSARCANNAGICNEYLGEYEASARFYFMSLEASEEFGDELLAARSQLNIGMLYIRMQEYNKAINILEISLSTLQELKDESNIINAYQNLFIAEGETKNPSKAKAYFDIALNLAKQMNDSVKIADLQMDYGNLMHTYSNYGLAIQHFKKALKYTDTIKAESQYYYTLYSIGKSEMYLGNLDKAKYLMLSSYEQLKERDANIWLTNLQLNLSRLYARLGDFNQSDKYLQAALNHEQELFKKEKLKSISEIEIKYETDKKEQELAIQKLEIESQSRKILFFGITALLFAIGLAFVLILIRKIRINNKNLFERNKELTSRWEKLKVCTNSEKESSADSLVYKKITEFMNQDQLFKNPDLSLDLISKKISSNTKYVSRAIKESTGMNFNTFINTHRIEEAKRILLDPVQSSWSLDAVAEHCGFNNPTTFYTSFKKYTGLTPANYRNINLE